MVNTMQTTSGSSQEPAKSKEPALPRIRKEKEVPSCT
jgi:hypothetical protein